MGIELRKINGNDSFGLYVIEGDPTNSDYIDFNIWLDTHCLDDYKLDRYHLFIGTKSELFLALTWSIHD